MKSRSKWLVLALVMVFGLVLVACAPAAPTQAPAGDVIEAFTRIIGGQHG